MSDLCSHYVLCFLSNRNRKKRESTFKGSNSPPKIIILFMKGCDSKWDQSILHNVYWFILEVQNFYKSQFINLLNLNNSPKPGYDHYNSFVKSYYVAPWILKRAFQNGFNSYISSTIFLVIVLKYDVTVLSKRFVNEMKPEQCVGIKGTNQNIDEVL